MRDVWQVGSRHFAVAPSLCALRCFGVAVEHRIWPVHTANVSTRQLLGCRVLPTYRLFEMSEGCRSETRQHPSQVRLVRDAPGLRHKFFPRRRCESWQEPALALLLHHRLHPPPAAVPESFGPTLARLPPPAL